MWAQVFSINVNDISCSALKWWWWRHDRSSGEKYGEISAVMSAASLTLSLALCSVWRVLLKIRSQNQSGAEMQIVWLRHWIPYACICWTPRVFTVKNSSCTTTSIPLCVGYIWHIKSAMCLHGKNKRFPPARCKNVAFFFFSFLKFMHDSIANLVQRARQNYIWCHVIFLSQKLGKKNKMTACVWWESISTHPDWSVPKLLHIWWISSRSWVFRYSLSCL